jgi:probable phosphoglycerate mutase
VKTTAQKWPSNLVIVRHGESERNVAKDRAKRGASAHTFGLGLRDMDTPLTKRGLQQARETGAALAKPYRFDAVFSSPYRRALQTSECILSCLEDKPPIVLEERLREIEFGILDGLTKEGIKKKYPEEYARREREKKYWYRPPGGESRPDVALRVHSFLGTLTRDYRGKSVFIVCHSVVVLIFRRLLERWTEDQYLRVDREEDVLNCSVTAYRYERHARKLALECYNKICYADGKRLG